MRAASRVYPSPFPALGGRALRLFPALTVPSFRLLWLGMLPGTLGWQMSTVATGYAAFVLSDSATTLGLVSSAIGFPMLLLSLVGGVVADRFPRRTIVIASQCVLGISAAVLAGLSISGVLVPWHLVVLGLAQGTAFAFNMPARQAYVAELVPPELLRSAVSLNNAGVNFCRIAGPALAGVLLSIPFLGVGGVFALMTAMYVAVLSSLFRLPAGKSPLAEGEAAGSGTARLLEGLRYIRSSPALVALLGLAFVPIFFGMPYQQLMPVFSERVFDVGAAGLGTLMAANGVGALAGSLLVAAIAGGSLPLSRMQLGFGTGFGLLLIAFAFAPGYGMAVVLLALVGFCSAGYTALNSTMIMGNTDRRLYGRVMSVYLLTFGFSPLAVLPAAWLADNVGAPLTIAAGGAIVAITVAGVALLYAPYRRIR